MTMPMSEPTGWRRWLAWTDTGNADAFGQLMEAHAAMVLRTAQRLLLSDTDAQDAAQEVFLKLHRFAARFDAGRDLRPWLYRMTVNVCHDLRRKRKRHVNIDDTAEPAAIEATPEQQWSAEEQRQLLYKALASLSDREREAIVLRDLEGRTTAEVGEAMGTTEATVRSQIAAGRARLKQYLAVRMRNGL
jgi:RNA polymerase sigma-70 factor (ECF subfamily)